MLGFINRAFESFVRDTCGAEAWARVARRAGLVQIGFEPMQRYDDRVTEDVIRAMIAELQCPRDSLLEDLGTYLVSHPNLERLRRLLRFGGVDFAEFLHSLEDLPARGRLALPELDLPRLTLHDLGDGVLRLECTMAIYGIGHIVVGLLRAMADDYGVLVLVDFDQTLPSGAETVAIHLLDYRHSNGRSFDLSAMIADQT